MQRLIVTGANGAGKSHIARQLNDLRPAIPLISFDAIKLTSGWKQRPRREIEAELSDIVATHAWILEGGPSLLHHALPRAQAVIWLDPSELVRAWRLISRPWRNLGKTRPELPLGNVDWPLQQYRFAFRSIKKRATFRNYIATTLDAAEDKVIWHCRSQRQIDDVIDHWRSAGTQSVSGNT
ncbi:DNA topology modulation protein FlaR [uncultured Roseobacter sp.]|uniref:DNA topology modulation protein FlaR n=1 Tax=uncultured Roseobacter sp. TaxID=114847 RepID=UPI002624F729|nr:DNA topology modulation protein FlaR [uncultured Roseobacter sp.]